MCEGDAILDKHVLIIGSGRSGRGMLGEMFYNAGYQITFADRDAKLVEGLRQAGQYAVEMTNLKSGHRKECTVSGFHVLNTEQDRTAYLDLLASIPWISTALMPEAFDQVIQDLAEAARLRQVKGIQTEQFITLGANFVGLKEYCTAKLKDQLSPEEWLAYNTHSHLVMSIVNRKNLLPEKKDPQDPYRVVGDDKPVLRVEISPELESMPTRPPFFQLESGLDQAMAIKIWSGNLVQCSMAFVALQGGLTGTYEASFHPVASRYAFFAAREGYQAVAAEYGLPPRSPEEELYPVTLFRSKDFNDSLLRLVRDPIRKLGRNERFIGPALCCVRHQIVPYYITRCCAYAFLYNNSQESQSMELQRYLKKWGIEQTVQDICQLKPQEPDDRQVWQLIVNAYRDITAENPLNQP